MLTMVPPVHVAFLGEAYELPNLAINFAINLLINVFVTLSNGKQRPPRSKVPCDDNPDYH